MHLSILSRQKPIFTGEVRSVTLPGSVAPFQVLPKHTNIISTLTKGRVSYEALGGKVHNISIEKGLVKVKDDTVTVLVDALIPA